VNPRLLKSDQDGIESASSMKTAIFFMSSLKSDQDGIERTLHNNQIRCLWNVKIRPRWD